MKKQLVYGIMATIVACAFGLNSCNYEDLGDDGHGGGSGGGAVADSKGQLPGVFSVGKNQYIAFSRGNLQFQAASRVWRFAEHQYDEIGTDNGKVSSTYGGWIDLFAWGTSGSKIDAVPCYQPYSASASQYDYLDGGPKGTGAAGLTGEYVKSDWGMYNPISNGGNKAGYWRTITAAEWDYLIGARPNADDLHGSISFPFYIPGTTLNVAGYLLLPDDFELEGKTGIQALDEAHMIPTNEDEEWESKWRKLEKAGAVCLPFALSRRGNEVLVGKTTYPVYYWTSSGNDTYDYEAFVIGYPSACIETTREAHPVRLVRSVKK